MQALLLLSVSSFFFFFSIIIHIKGCLVTGMSNNSVSESLQICGKCSRCEAFQKQCKIHKEQRCRTPNSLIASELKQISLAIVS
jgi:hypothetical protein